MNTQLKKHMEAIKQFRKSNPQLCEEVEDRLAELHCINSSAVEGVEMGVSQWLEYGKKFGYVDYWKSHLIEEIEKLPVRKCEEQFAYTKDEDGVTTHFTDIECVEKKGVIQIINNNNE